jgi:hypothetical protein
MEARAVNAFAAAQELFASIAAQITSPSITGTGVAALSTTSKTPEQLEAESALANACSCRMVARTATVTEFFTAPTVVCHLITVLIALANSVDYDRWGQKPVHIHIDRYSRLYGADDCDPICANQPKQYNVSHCHIFPICT